MDKWRLAVCDDDRAALDIVSGSLVSAFRGYGIEASVELFTRTRDLERRMEETAFDLLFLDIDMPGTDGIAFGRRLRERDSQVDIIYISNREDRVFEALRVNPGGFIRKSRFLEDMRGTIGAYLADRPRTESPKLVVQNREQVSAVPLDAIRYIEGRGKNQMVHVAGREEPLQLRRLMQELEEELVPLGFLRVHKGYLVNSRFIRRVGDSEVLLTGGEKIPLSRRKVQETRERFLEIMRDGGAVVL